MLAWESLLLRTETQPFLPSSMPMSFYPKCIPFLSKSYSNVIHIKLSVYVAGSLSWLCAGGAKLVQQSCQKLNQDRPSKMYGELIHTRKMIQPGVFSRFSQPAHFSRFKTDNLLLSTARFPGYND